MARYLFIVALVGAVSCTATPNPPQSTALADWRTYADSLEGTLQRSEPERRRITSPGGALSGEVSTWSLQDGIRVRHELFTQSDLTTETRQYYIANGRVRFIRYIFRKGGDLSGERQELTFDREGTLIETVPQGADKSLLDYLLRLRNSAEKQ
jgi:hypothetical protein